MKKIEKKCFYSSLKESKECINDAIDIFNQLNLDKEVPDDIRDRVKRIALALSIDIEEINRMRKFVIAHE